MNINSDYTSIDPVKPFCQKVKDSPMIERVTAIALVVFAFSLGMLFYDHLAATGNSHSNPFLIGGIALFATCTIIKALHERIAIKNDPKSCSVQSIFQTALNIPSFGVLTPFLSGMVFQGIVDNQTTHTNPNAEGVSEQIQSCIDTLTENWPEYFITTETCLKGPDMICSVMKYDSITLSPYPKNYPSFASRTLNLTDLPEGTCAYRNLSYSDYQTNLLAPMLVRFHEFTLGNINVSEGRGIGTIGLTMETLCSQFDALSTQASLIDLQFCFTNRTIEFLGENSLIITELEAMKPIGHALPIAASGAVALLCWIISKRCKRNVQSAAETSNSIYSPVFKGLSV
jgi:hypothetical protein